MVSYPVEQTGRQNLHVLILIVMDNGLLPLRRSGGERVLERS